jgi:hypothetical protein
MIIFYILLTIIELVIIACNIIILKQEHNVWAAHIPAFAVWRIIFSIIGYLLIVGISKYIENLI